ncbi:MAG: hypothetical protein KatS3mg052_2506 [Candidatus Roseilinea sp.]|nr:MAG: hypothetical protein KatS3mg052_2506 [Candidatus Roseilinea sp.]
MVESDHPYANLEDKLWLVSNPDANAGATRLRFARFELEEGVDWLLVLDAYDNEMQRLTGRLPDNFWTEPVPGTMVKLRLVTDGSVRRWGFAVDALASVPYTTLAYSPHPYPHNSSLEWRFNNLDANAAGTRLHFSRVELEENVDWLVIMDITERPYQWITGSHPDGLWTIGVPGNGVIVRLISDGSVRKWGFNLDALESAKPDEVQPRPEPEKALAESKHPYEPNKQLEWTLVNPNPAAAFSKVHFTRLELRGGDSLVLLDGNNNRIQTFGEDTDLWDFWSDDVPGRIVKVQLNAGDWREGWGFRIDRLVDGEAQAALAESPHPYYPNWTNTWTLVNPNPAAAFSKVHFTRLELRGGDSLVLLDGNNNRVQTFGEDTDLWDFWSDDVPGRIVKVQLNAGDWREGWGFRIDRLVDGEAQAALAESPHPYYPNWTNTWTLVNPNPAAAFSKVHFTRLELRGGDSLVLLDGNNNRIQTFGEGTDLWDFWSDDVPGRIVKVQLNAGDWREGWGFRIDDIAPKAEEKPTPAFVTSVRVRLGQPGDLWLNNVYLGRASVAGEYLVRLPQLGENLIAVETLFHRQEIVVGTEKDGSVRIEYSGIQPKEK